MSIKISIVVPVYNVEKYLRTCLNSIINQTLKDIEIICVDDGSTDNSPLILAEYAIKDSRIKVITKQNFGYGNTMNIGISHAQGEYLGIVESDDYIDEYMYEILYKTAKQNDLDIAKSLFTSFDNDSGGEDEDKCNYVTKNKVIFPSEDISPFLLTPSIWSAIYKLSLIRDNDISFSETPGAAYQDTAFFFKTHIMAKKYMLINKSLIFYRVSHAASSSTAIGANKMFCILGEWDEVFKYINAKKLSDYALQIAYSLKYSGVDWLFSRLDKHQQYKYLSRIKNELKNDISNINMDIFETILPRKKLFMLNLIKNFPSLFIFFYKFKFLINKYIK